MSGSSVPGEAVPGLITPGGGVAAASSGWPEAYTYNFCPNPSVEVSLTGYGSLTGTETVAQDYTLAWSGQASLRFTTPGSVPGEGISTPAGTVLASVTGSMSLYVWGETGSLTVQAIANPGGQVLGTFPVLLDGGDWQRVILNNLPLQQNYTVQLVVYTTTAQAITAYIDAVQYEPDNPAHAYIDGDSQYCTWTGTPGLSASYQQYQNPVGMSGTMHLDGSLQPAVYGEVFTLGLTGSMDMSGMQHQMAAVSSPLRTVIPPAVDPGVVGLPWEISGGGSITGVTVVNPGAAFSDFAIYQTGTDPDPAMTLIGDNNAGTENASNTATSWTRLYGTFSAPQQSLDSAGRARWQAAAYMAAGFRIASQSPWAAGAPGSVNFAQVQVERMTQQGPAAYQLPRALSTIVKPTNMNYVQNPGFETTGTNWNEYWYGPGVTMTQVPGGYQGDYCMQVSTPEAGQGVWTVVTDLIVGDTYTASAYIEPVSANIQDVYMTIGLDGPAASSVATDFPYGAGGYGSGPYGGLDADAGAMATGSWGYRPYLSFTATASTMNILFGATAVTGATYPLVFNIDAVMVSPGEVLIAYADGSSDGWQWELGGTPGLSRSYYYERESAGANAVQQVLDQHIPLGISAYAPVFALPATQ